MTINENLVNNREFQSSATNSAVRIWACKNNNKTQLFYSYHRILSGFSVHGKFFYLLSVDLISKSCLFRSNANVNFFSTQKSS